MSKIKREKRPRRFILWSLLAFLVVLAGIALDLWLTLPDVSGLKTQNPASTSLMRLREKQALRKHTALRVQQEWVAFKDIPPLLKKAVLVSEDAAFYSHGGIDFVELRETVKRDVKEGRFVRGGSTITQQLAKNLYLSTEKTLWRKLREALIARRLEKSLSKDRIFYLYMNFIELGQGVFGVQAAARYYFGCSVSELSLDQIVRLTAIIPRPLRTDPRGESTWLKWRYSRIYDLLRLTKAIDEND